MKMEEIIEDESVMEEEKEEGALNYTQENISGIDSSGKVSFIEIKHKMTKYVHYEAHFIN